MEDALQHISACVMVTLLGQTAQNALPEVPFCTADGLTVLKVLIRLTVMMD